MNYIFLIVGFILLVKGADIFVDGSSSIAKILKIPPIIIGLTIVAFGTSAPEAAVSITASINGQNGMAIGNVIGSNIFNLLMVVGASGFISTLLVEKSILSRELPFVLITSILLIVLSADIFISGSSSYTLSRMDGAILLILFAGFVYYLVSSALKSRNSSLNDDETSLDIEVIDRDIIVQQKSSPMSKSIFLSVVGILAIILGGKIVVDCASNIASSFGISDQLIGLTVVAIGTSLPEFVTSIVAATKGESDLALGNVIGSNIFNILFVLGISALISPMIIDPKLFIDGAIMIIATIITFLFAYRKNNVNKYESLTLMILYVAYMAYLIMTA
ncbi:calcium/sodium antiporter [Clostridium sp. CCUG 7971]|uniref:calcium/sodium antiporter n=1 Tax=Clostridium sp. CCUG 7971 TaxID=2811414 RepID=UPI001ABA1054|nr:calcium/sodium antiporter [Clostridium sp. CCUG 7971]MBO3444155.1 calcium/sodium antiporter [Clostridium sp. CCUG 7971]